MIRVHRHAALLFSQDAEALAELAATESTRACLGPRIAPTIAWIDHRRIEALRQALLRAGYAPKVTTDGSAERAGNGTHHA